MPHRPEIKQWPRIRGAVVRSKQAISCKVAGLPHNYARSNRDFNPGLSHRNTSLHFNAILLVSSPTHVQSLLLKIPLRQGKGCPILDSFFLLIQLEEITAGQMFCHLWLGSGRLEHDLCPGC